MAQENVVTELALKLASDKVIKNISHVRWSSITLHIKHTIDFHEFVEFVDSVVDECHRNSKNDMFTAYELFDFAVRANVVVRYASVMLPADLETQYKILYATDLYDIVCENISKAQLNAAIDTIKYYL